MNLLITWTHYNTSFNIFLTTSTKTNNHTHMHACTCAHTHMTNGTQLHAHRQSIESPEKKTMHACMHAHTHTTSTHACTHTQTSGTQLHAHRQSIQSPEEKTGHTTQRLGQLSTHHVCCHWYQYHTSECENIKTVQLSEQWPLEQFRHWHTQHPGPSNCSCRVCALNDYEAITEKGHQWLHLLQRFRASNVLCVRSK